jgi:hypothetical protein
LSHDSHDELGEAEEGEEGEERNAGEAVLSAHDHRSPQVDDQAPAEHDDAYPRSRGE